ncbi:methionyl-tRNA formyltransferase [Mycoplasmopsis agassizii]|uniref:Methionyl-tRNA formyltransferase n=1 Tax=Mycoplasmopsis agassizii TaxID=33922 RepID=A0ABX4H4J7_9BACT|nr:methionyl-tRNA formyltransferase [Mycoplasmopsis agassizii]PAF54703.1 methionyl-tRNA formyltransferase [Mycoplasmopsis agassizii]SMC15981.1 methionyl-tRNA formyltransferase [Mycoplasmopsis agassizii]
MKGNKVDKLKIVLAGTGDFAYPSFKKVIENFEVVAIITQPDKPAGRGLNLKHNKVKELASFYDIKLFTPEKIGTIYEELKVLNFDIFLTASYGQYIPMRILELPKLASLNIHGSLLPKYRGAAPIQYSLLNGDEFSGLSLIYMSKEMDAGNILKTAKYQIQKTDIADDLFKELAVLASENIVQWLVDFKTGNFSEIIQNLDEVVPSPKLQKSDAELDLENFSNQKLINKVRAFATNPGAFLMINNKRVKVNFAVENLEILDIKVRRHPSLIKVKTRDSFIYLTDYQFEGKKRIKIYPTKN